MFTVTGYEKLNDLRLPRNPRSTSQPNAQTTATREALDRLVAGDEAVLVVDELNAKQVLFTRTSAPFALTNGQLALVLAKSDPVRAAIFDVLDFPPTGDHIGWCFDTEDLGPDWTEDKANAERQRFADAVEERLLQYVAPVRFTVGAAMPDEKLRLLAQPDRLDYIAGQTGDAGQFADKLRDDVATIRQEADTTRIEQIRDDVTRGLSLIMPTRVERVEEGEQPGTLFLHYREGAETVRYRVTIARD